MRLCSIRNRARLRWRLSPVHRRFGALIALLASAASAAEPPWDEAVALATAEALDNTPPGLAHLTHTTADAWGVTLSSMNGSVRCEAARGAPFVCSAFSGLGEVVGGFVARLKVPPTRRFELKLVSTPASAPMLMLTQAEGTTWSRRIIGQWSTGASSNQWATTDAISRQADTADETLEGSASAMAISGGLLLVLTSADGGNGNNASGTLSFRAITIVFDDQIAHIVDTVELGGGSWGRSVTDEGITARSKANFLCPRLARGGFELIEACPSSVDPRGASNFSQWCSSPCTTQRRALKERSGLYLVRQGIIRKALGASIRAPRKGDLSIVEIPEPQGSTEFEYLELKNRSKGLLALSGVVIASSSSQIEISNEPECFVNPGETILLNASQNELAPGVTCRASASGSLDESKIEVTSPRRFLPNGDEVMGASLTSVSFDFPQRDWFETADEPRRSWQVDDRGKACLLPSSPGRPNSPCP